MDKKTGIILGVIVTLFGGLLAVSFWQRDAGSNVTKYDLNNIIAADENSGNLPENIEGNPDAPILIFEYGDYQCTACAPMAPHISKLVEEYDGKVAVVFRTYIMSYHQNGTAAAAAAQAAAIQGYWTEYKDLLYANQNDWYYSDAVERQKQFEQYFEQVTDGKGDLEKFRSDMESKEVAKKIKFDAKLSDEVNLDWTPTFYLDGELMDQRNISTAEFISKLRTKIDKLIEEKGL